MLFGQIASLAFRLIFGAFSVFMTIVFLNFLFEQITVTPTELVRTTFLSRTLVSMADIIAATCSFYGGTADTVLALETKDGKLYWARSYGTKTLREMAQLINAYVGNRRARAASP